MPKALLNFLIFSTAIVGFPAVLQGQVNTSDSVEIPTSELSVDTPPNTLPDDSSKFSLSTDSVYATPLGTQSEGLLPSMVEYTASDSIVGNLALGEAYLYKDAYVKYEQLELKAGFISINFNTSEVYAEGIKDTSGKTIQKPVFTESGKTYRADNMRYNFKSKKAKIKKVITKEGEGFLHGEDVKKVDDNTFFIKNASYTTCSHEHPHFRINTPKAKVIAGNEIVTQFAYIEVLDVPTPLMVPFGFFPTTSQRKSGIIIPNYGNSQYRGYFLTGGGYYWAINDYLDFTATGDIYTQGGYGLRGSTAYRKRYKFNGALAVSYNKIKFGREEFAEFGNQFFDNRSDFSITWNHQQDAKARPDFRFNGNVNIASQNFYRVTSVAAEDVLNNQLASSVSVQKTWPGRPYNLNVSLNHNQNNQTKDLSLKLPEATFSWNRFFPFQRKTRVGKKRWYEEIGMSYNVTGKNQINTKLGKPLFTETVFRDSSRNGIQHRIPIQANYKVFKFFVLNPSINYTERWYFQRSVYEFDPERNRAVVADTTTGFYTIRDFNSSANLSTKLYGQFRYKGYVRALRHVVTPTVGLSYRPDFSKSFWGYYQEVQSDTLGNTDFFNQYNYGIYGSPGAGEQGNINFGLQNTLEAKVRDKQDSTGLKKVKILERVSLNTSYNMAAEEFNWSQLRLTMSSSAFNNLINANYSANYDFYGYDEDQGKRVNEFASKVNGTLLRTTNQTLTLGMSLSPQRFKRKGSKKREKINQPPQGLDNDEEEGLIDELENPTIDGVGVTAGDIDYYRRRNAVEFELPWSLNLNYNLRKSYQGLEATVAQSVDVSGDLELTKNWRVGFRTGYDIVAKDFTYTSFDFYRDLHCWELRATWIPMGFQQSYTLTIRVKAPTLKDLKLERRRGYGDEGGGTGLPTLPGF